MSAFEYPSSDELLEAEERVEEILQDPAIQEIIKLRCGKLSLSMDVAIGGGAGEVEGSGGKPPQKERALPDSFEINEGFNFDYGKDTYQPTEDNFTYDKPYGIGDLERMLVCRTSEYDFDSGKVKVISANPNDPKHIFEAMANNSENNRVAGTLRLFQQRQVSSTTQISEIFAKEAMDAEYKKHCLKPGIISSPSAANASPLNGQISPQNANSHGFAMNNKGFHEFFHKNFLLQMNHRLTQEAIEKNRSFFPNGDQVTDEDRRGFTWDKFQSVAKQAAEDAFKRATVHIQFRQKYAEADKVTKGYAERFKETLKPKIISENFVDTFGKRFNKRKHESNADAVSRIRKEYREFSNKKFDELQGKGIEIIIAQGIARSRGLNSVSVDHIKEARDIFDKARKNPVDFRSTERIIRQVSGSDRELANSLLRNLDGRSTFQRSFSTLERFGEHLNANQNDRTRIRMDDKLHGQAFAASSLLGLSVVRDKDVRQETIRDGMARAMKERGYSADEALKARSRMLKSRGKLKTEDGKNTNRERILETVTSGAVKKLQREQEPAKPKERAAEPTGQDQEQKGARTEPEGRGASKKPVDDDDGPGFEPGGGGPGRKKGRGR